jgi:hypothetical protein
MRLVGQLHVHVRTKVILRDPSFFEKLKAKLGGKVDLDTGRVKNELEATAVVDQVRRALGRMGVGNALSLVIDDQVIFQDSDGKADDLPDLVIALSEHASVFGKGFRELRFAAEHEEAGLRLVIETRAYSEHANTAPAAVLSIGGRIAALEAKKGESAEAYRARVEPLTRDAALFETSRHAFEAFVHRLERALADAMPEARIEEHKAEARLVRAPSKDVQAPAQATRDVAHPAYDPFMVYYPSPMTTMLDAMMFASFMNMMMPPPIMVVSPMGSPLGTMDQVRAEPERASPEAVAEADQAQAADGQDVDNDFAGDDVEGDHGDVDGDAGWDAGGGFDGGGFSDD